MTPQEFKEALKKRGSYDPQTLPHPPQSKFWGRVFRAMYPHWVGVMPTSIIKAFPNESLEQTQYHSDIHTSKTKPQLWQAIRDVKRVMMGDGMSIEGDVVLMDTLNRLRFGEAKTSFDKYMWDIAYPRRVLDPNGVLAIIPKPTQPNEPLQLDLKLFNSDYIEFVGVMGDEEVIILKDGSREQFYYIFTKNEVLYHKRNKSSNKWETDYIYIHNNNDFGVYVLGGREHTSYDVDTDREVVYFESDFGDSVGVMEDFERQNSQIQASTITTLYPFRIVRGMECDVCEGKGYVEEYRNERSGEIKGDHHHHHSNNTYLEYEEMEVDEGSDGQKYYEDFMDTHRKTCQKCGGTGTLPISQLDSLIIAPKSNNPFVDDSNNTNDNLGSDFIAFVSPPVEPIRELREQKNETKKELEESLNLTKPSKFAESGVSKEKDREGKKTMLKSISDSMAMLMEKTLKGIYKYTTLTPNPTALQEIKVTTPSNFEIKSLADLEEEMYKDFEKKDLGIRWENKKNYISQKYGSNSQQLEREKLVFEFTQGLYLYTAKELLELEGMGLIEREDFIKATKTPAWIIYTYSPEKTKDQIFRELEELTTQSIPQPPAQLPPPLDLRGGEE